MNPLPNDKPVFSFYGDDFTGSTDALEAFAANGVPAVLFLRAPATGDLCQFNKCRAVGIAGSSRSRSPQWMRAELPAVFERLRVIGAPIVQYKVCSTFDSSPEIGSIGCAMEIGARVFGGDVPGNRAVPVVPAAPRLGRYVVFGNLFAAYAGGTYRIDRHPAMSAHPTTPMDEADLLRHLALQTSGKLALVDLHALRGDSFQWPADAQGVVFDGLDLCDLTRAARRIWDHRAAPQTFVVGSSGLTYGMLDFWRCQSWLPHPEAGGEPALSNDGRLLVLAGSCSPSTEAQVRRGLQSGFHGIRLNPSDPAAHRVEAEALAELSAGRSVILYSALGPADRVEIADPGALSAAMGRLLRNLILASKVSRVVVAGGDTSSYAVQELGVSALTFLAPLAVGAPLCRAHGFPYPLELVLKGGQIGPESFFEDVRTRK